MGMGQTVQVEAAVLNVGGVFYLSSGSLWFCEHCLKITNPQCQNE